MLSNYHNLITALYLILFGSSFCVSWNHHCGKEVLLIEDVKVGVLLLFLSGEFVHILLKLTFSLFDQ